MHSIPWYLSIAISIPQTILIIYIGFSLCNINVQLNKCIICSIFIAVVSYFIRRLPIPLAANTLILTLILVITTGLILGIHFRKTLVAVLLGVMISGVIESVVIQVFLQITDHVAEELLVDAVLNLMAYIPVFVITLAIFLLIKRFNFVVFDLNEKKVKSA